MKNDISDNLKDIYRSMQLTQDFISSLSFEEYKQDEKTQYALIRCLEVIGEAVKRIPDDFRSLHSDIPWKAMAGMQDRLIHGYDIVDDNIIWNTVTLTVPVLIPKFEEIITRFPDQKSIE